MYVLYVFPMVVRGQIKDSKSITHNRLILCGHTHNDITWEHRNPVKICIARNIPTAVNSNETFILLLGNLLELYLDTYYFAVANIMKQIHAILKVKGNFHDTGLISSLSGFLRDTTLSSNYYIKLSLFLSFLEISADLYLNNYKTKMLMHKWLMWEVLIYTWKRLHDNILLELKGPHLNTRSYGVHIVVT